MTQTTAQLRKLLDRPEMLLAPFVYDGLQAKIAERTGFAAVYMTGFGTAAARGYPDLGLLTMTEMVQNVRAISHAVNLPVICDADTGYGNAVNVWRTVREYEDAGADALAVNGWEDVARRARTYRAAGADLIFVDGIRTLDDLKRYATELGDLP